MMKSLNLLVAILTSQCHAFVVMNSNQKVGMKKSTPSKLAALLSMELEKPLGIILEEVEENAAQGVKVEELSDAGSAYASEYRDELVGLKVMQVMDTDVSNMNNEDN